MSTILALGGLYCMNDNNNIHNDMSHKFFSAYSNPMQTFENTNIDI